MEATVFGYLARRLGTLNDERHHNFLHPLASVVSIAVVAVLCNADSWRAVARFAEMERKWLSLFIPLPHGVPSRQTFERVFAMLNIDELERCLMAWFAEMNQWKEGSLKQVALDGKALRRSYRHAWDTSGMAYLVSAYACENGLVLAQTQTSGKGQELEGTRKLLNLLKRNLKGAVVTTDALGCQKDIAATVKEYGGDYCLAVKGNQSALHGKVKKLLDEGLLEEFAGWRAETDRTTDGGHGRIEVRTAWVTDEVEHLGQDLLGQWKGLCAMAVVESRREVLGPKSKVTTQRRYYILSRRFSAGEVQQLARQHWGIENGLHHVLDVTYREDESRIRVRSAGHFSRLRRLTSNMLKLEQSVQDSIAGKRERCALSREYRVTVLARSTAAAASPGAAEG